MFCCIADEWILAGRTRFSRLYLIGTCSTHLSTEALKLAVAEAKSGKDVGRYERAVRALAEVAPNDNEATLDTKWVENMRKVVSAETDRLEHELRGYKNNLIKESIRVCLTFQRTTVRTTGLFHEDGQ